MKLSGGSRAKGKANDLSVTEMAMAVNGVVPRVHGNLKLRINFKSTLEDDTT
jgi:hypothetical protein